MLKDPEKLPEQRPCLLRPACGLLLLRGPCCLLSVTVRCAVSIESNFG
jgi:hypothetical protein